jgi:hypothetical protein
MAAQVFLFLREQQKLKSYFTLIQLNDQRKVKCNAIQSPSHAHSFALLNYFLFFRAQLFKALF